MQNALMPPQAPNPDPQQQGGGNALQPAPGQQQQGQQPGAPPAPSHQQTVAALRHFDAIETELTGLLSDPECGKTNMKSQIIDGTSKLVSRGIMSAATAVGQLATVPERPFDQKKFLEQHLAQTAQARIAVLAHHQTAFGGQSVDSSAPNADNHQDTMAGVTDMYKSAPQAPQGQGGQGNG